jgi:hypothetical protein
VERRRRIPGGPTITGTDDLLTISPAPAAEEGARLSFASRADDDEKSLLFRRDRSKSLGGVANLGSPVDAAHEPLVVTAWSTAARIPVCK